jgi:hypothetical protein
VKKAISEAAWSRFHLLSRVKREQETRRKEREEMRMRLKGDENEMERRGEEEKRKRRQYRGKAEDEALGKAEDGPK